MSIFKRGEKFYCDITTQDGRRIVRSLKTCDKREAQEAHDRLKHILWQENYLDKKVPMTWEQACMRWLDDKSEKRSLDADARIIENYTKYFAGVEIHTLTSDQIIAVTKKITSGRVYYNRHIAFIRSLLNRAVVHWQWIDKAPPLTLLSEPKKRIRYLTQIEAQRLLDELPEHLHAMVKFSLYTGLRHANVTGLKWKNIDLANKLLVIDAKDFKNGRDHSIPLNDTALDVLYEQRGKHDEYVFIFKGQRVLQANTKAFKKALDRAGISNFRWHDLRHTWASWMIQAGVSTEALQELGGWESREMVMRYAHLSKSHLADFINKINETKAPTPMYLIKKAG